MLFSKEAGNGSETNNDSAFWLDSKETYNDDGELLGCS